MMRQPKKAMATPADRLTITLGEGQRDTLEAIAKFNDTTLAYVVRYALWQFIRDNKDKQIRLAFPPAGEITSQ